MNGRQFHQHSLAQSRRRRLMQEARASSNQSNLWLLYDPARDKDLLLSGDLRMLHFYACEGDPDVRDVEYLPTEIELHGSGLPPVLLDAIVTKTDGQVEGRVIRRVPGEEGSELATHRRLVFERACAQIGAQYRELSPTYFQSNSLRILNWMAAIATLKRCRLYPIELVEPQILCRVRKGPVRISQLLSCDAPIPLLLAAAVRLLRNRLITSDLDERPWSRDTTLGAGTST